MVKLKEIVTRESSKAVKVSDVSEMKRDMRISERSVRLRSDGDEGYLTRHKTLEEREEATWCMPVEYGHGQKNGDTQW